MTDVLLRMLSFVGFSIIFILLLFIWGGFIIVVMTVVKDVAKDRRERKEIDFFDDSISSEDKALLSHIENVRAVVRAKNDSANAVSSYFGEKVERFQNEFDPDSKKN